MKSDDIKLWFTYLIATLIIVGGGAMLFVSRNEGNSDFALVLAGFIGAAIQFVFNRETQTNTARSTERAMNSVLPAGVVAQETQESTQVTPA